MIQEINIPKEEWEITMRKTIFKAYWLKQRYSSAPSDEIYLGYGDTLKDVFFRFYQHGQCHQTWWTNKIQIIQHTTLHGQPVEAVKDIMVWLYCVDIHTYYEIFGEKLDSETLKLGDLFQ